MERLEGFDSPVYSKTVIEFVTIANEFCKFLENSEGLLLSEFIDTTHRILPLLYLKGTLIPETENSFEEFNEKFVNEEDYNYIHDTLLLKFGEHNFYDEVFDPLRRENDEPAQLSLAENFADIYQDVKDFLMQYRVGTEEIMGSAIWECRQAFEQYWGQRIVNALRVLHHLKYTVVELDSEAKSSNTSDLSNIDTSNWLISRMQEGYEDEG